MKTRLLIFLTFIAATTAIAQNKGNVRLHGKLVDMGSNMVTMVYDGE